MDLTDVDHLITHIQKSFDQNANRDTIRIKLNELERILNAKAQIHQDELTEEHVNQLARLTYRRQLLQLKLESLDQYANESSPLLGHEIIITVSEPNDQPHAHNYMPRFIICVAMILLTIITILLIF